MVETFSFKFFDVEYTISGETVLAAISIIAVISISAILMIQYTVTSPTYQDYVSITNSTAPYWANATTEVFPQVTSAQSNQMFGDLLGFALMIAGIWAIEYYIVYPVTRFIAGRMLVEDRLIYTSRKLDRYLSCKSSGCDYKISVHDTNARVKIRKHMRKEHTEKTGEGL